MSWLLSPLDRGVGDGRQENISGDTLLCGLTRFRVHPPKAKYKTEFLALHSLGIGFQECVTV